MLLDVTNPDDPVSSISLQLTTPVTAATLMVQRAQMTVAAMEAAGVETGPLATNLHCAGRNIERLARLVEQLIDVTNRPP